MKWTIFILVLVYYSHMWPWFGQWKSFLLKWWFSYNVKNISFHCNTVTLLIRKIKCSLKHNTQKKNNFGHFVMTFNLETLKTIEKFWPPILYFLAISIQLLCAFHIFHSNLIMLILCIYLDMLITYFFDMIIRIEKFRP